jgi:DNA-nicking Smr family endonuclease
MTRRPQTPAPPPPPASDAELFRAAVGPVQPHVAAPEPPPAMRPVVSARSRTRDDEEVLRELKHGGFEGVDSDGTALLEYLAPGYSPKLLRKLKRGQYVLGDELDLHQFGVEAARGALNQFLSESRAGGTLAVRVVHGKGLRSGTAGPVLKQLTERTLLQRHDVIAFASCKPAAGGTGAVMVLLKA